MIHEEHQIVETFGPNSDDSEMDCEPVTRTDFADEVGVVFEIHGAGMAAEVIGIGEADGEVKGIAGVVEYGDEVTDVHVAVAVCPFGERSSCVAGRAEFLNLILSDVRGLPEVGIPLCEPDSLGLSELADALRAQFAAIA